MEVKFSFESVYEVAHCNNWQFSMKSRESMMEQKHDIFCHFLCYNNSNSVRYYPSLDLI